MAHLPAGPCLQHSAIAVLFALTVSAHASAADAECDARWRESSAYRTCSLHDSTQSPKGVCTLVTVCDETSGLGGEMITSTWTLGSVSKLSNSNGMLAGGDVPKPVAPVTPARVPLPEQ